MYILKFVYSVALHVHKMFIYSPQLGPHRNKERKGTKNIGRYHLFHRAYKKNAPRCRIIFFLFGYYRDSVGGKRYDFAKIMFLYVCMDVKHSKRLKESSNIHQ